MLLHLMPVSENAKKPVWDEFLTSQDKALAANQPRKPFGFGKVPALLLIDLYKMAFGPKPEEILESVKRVPSSCGMAAWDSVPHIKKLVAVARGARIPVVFSTGSDERESGIASWAERGRETGSRRSSWNELSGELFSTRFEILNELAPLPGEVLIPKSAPSVFFGTPLLSYLNSLKVDTIITCGESTSGCVRATVVDGRSYSYRMIVVEECVFDRTQASHAINLFDMNEKYADVVPISKVLEYLSGFIGNLHGMGLDRQTIKSAVQ
jgi:maleamate amidohydrolase